MLKNSFIPSETLYSPNGHVTRGVCLWPNKSPIYHIISWGYVFLSNLVQIAGVTSAL